jgi:ABC-type sulfate transport system substrate-binding protein
MESAMRNIHGGSSKKSLALVNHKESDTPELTGGKDITLTIEPAVSMQHQLAPPT